MDGVSSALTRQDTLWPLLFHIVATLGHACPSSMSTCVSTRGSVNFFVGCYGSLGTIQIFSINMHMQVRSKSALEHERTCTRTIYSRVKPACKLPNKTSASASLHFVAPDRVLPPSRNALSVGFTLALRYAYAVVLWLKRSNLKLS